MNIWAATLLIVVMVWVTGYTLDSKLDKIKKKLENKNKKATKIDGDENYLIKK